MKMFYQIAVLKKIVKFPSKHTIYKESAKWRAQRSLRALRALLAHVPKYILQNGKLKNGNFVSIHF